MTKAFPTLAALAASMLLPALGAAQHREHHHVQAGTRVTTTVGVHGGTRTVVDPPGAGNATVVRETPSGATIVNPPGPGHIVVGASARANAVVAAPPPPPAVRAGVGANVVVRP